MPGARESLCLYNPESCACTSFRMSDLTIQQAPSNGRNSRYQLQRLSRERAKHAQAGGLAASGRDNLGSPTEGTSRSQVIKSVLPTPCRKRLGVSVLTHPECSRSYLIMGSSVGWLLSPWVGDTVSGSKQIFWPSQLKAGCSALAPTSGLRVPPQGFKHGINSLPFQLFSRTQCFGCLLFSPSQVEGVRVLACSRFWRTLG